MVSLHSKNSRVEEMGKIRKPSEQKRAYQWFCQLEGDDNTSDETCSSANDSVRP